MVLAGLCSGQLHNWKSTTYISNVFFSVPVEKKIMYQELGIQSLAPFSLAPLAPFSKGKRGISARE